MHFKVFITIILFCTDQEKVVENPLFLKTTKPKDQIRSLKPIPKFLTIENKKTGLKYYKWKFL